MLRKALLSITLSIFRVFAIASMVKADTPCNQVSTPSPGATCYQKVTVAC